MRAFRICLWLMLIIALFITGGCAGRASFQSPSAGESAPDAISLPPPSALHRASYLVQGLYHWGSEYSDALPSNNVRRNNQYVHFAPTAAAGGHKLADMAYAIYAFQLDGYDLEPALRFHWVKTQDFTDAWVAVADFPRDRWEWHAMPANGCLAFNPARNISATGAMYAVVLCAGTNQQQWQLQLLRVGPEMAAPAIWLTASPEADNAPIAVEFDAGGTFDPDGGAISKYEWDWDGDGVYDAETGAVSSAAHTYVEVGDFPAVVRATDNENTSSTRAITIRALNYNCAPDTLYAFPLAAHTGIGEPVRIMVATGQPASPLQFMEAVTVSFGQNGAYIPGSYNFGSPGGERTDTDGYWALLGPPAIADADYIDLPSRIPNPGALPGEGLKYLTYSVVPMGPSSVPASIGGGAILCSFQLSFSQPGTYPLRFIQNIEAEDMTFYYEANMTRHHWTLDQSCSIVVE